MPSTKDQDFLDFVVDQLSGLKAITSRRMFGGIGLYQGTTFFAIIDEGRLYFVTDDATRSEYANRGMDDLPMWKEFPTDKELGAGVIDVKAFKAETAEEVAERIRVLLRYVAPDKLWLNPDCGFWETPRWVVKQKLAALCEGARIVRAEL